MNERIKMRLVSLLIFITLSPLATFAQPHFANDTIAFQKFLKDCPFPATNMYLIQAIWVEMKPKRYKVVDYYTHTSSSEYPSLQYQQSNPQYNPHYDLVGSPTSQFFCDYIFSDPHYAKYNGATLMNLLKRDLKYLQDSVRESGMDVDSVKEIMVERLAAFDKAAYYKPIFFADIYSKYKGNYRKYVDALFRKSLITSSKRLRSFTAYARKKMLLKDMGFQFTLSLALYDLWIKQVKEGTRQLAEP